MGIMVSIPTGFAMCNPILGHLSMIFKKCSAKSQAEIQPQKLRHRDRKTRNVIACGKGNKCASLKCRGASRIRFRSSHQYACIAPVPRDT